MIYIKYSRKDNVSSVVTEEDIDNFEPTKLEYGYAGLPDGTMIGIWKTDDCYIFEVADR